MQHAAVQQSVNETASSASRAKQANVFMCCIELQSIVGAFH